MLIRFRWVVRFVRTKPHVAELVWEPAPSTEAISGFNPSDPKSDQGAAELDVLNYWRKSGIGAYQIDAYVALEPHSVEHVKDAIAIFGNCYIGLALPVTAQQQVVWTVPPGGPVGRGAPGSWGGHAVIVVGYDQRTLTVVTWGRLKQISRTLCRRIPLPADRGLTLQN